MSEHNPLAALLGLLAASAPLAAQQALFSSRIFATPPIHHASQIADLDGDGRLDLVYRATNAIEWRRGDGVGGFGPSLLLLSVPPGAGANLIATGDADGDADVDLYFSSGFQAHAELWLNSGAASFQLGGSAQLSGLNLLSARALDANGDGRLDFACASHFTAGGTFVQTLWLSVADASGALAAPVSQFAQDSGFFYGAADLDVDGDFDLVLHPGLRVSANQGGAYGTPILSSAGAFTDVVITGDLDGNGSDDVVAANGGAWSSLASNGLLDFHAPVALPAPLSDVPPTAADWDGDGDLDLGFADGAVLRVLLGDGAGGFQPGPVVALGTNHARWLGLYELDGAAPRELLTTTALASDVCVTRASASGAYAAYEAFALPSAIGALRGADLDRDGRLDLVAEPPAGASVATVLLGTATGPGAPTALDLQGAVVALRVADVDGDGRCDAIGTGSGGLRYALGDGAGHFGAAQTHPLVLAGNDLELADFNADGALDLLLASGALPSICYGGASGFAAPTPLPQALPPLPGSATNVASADVDGDGIGDPIGSVRPPSLFAPSKIAAWRSAGGTGYAAPSVVNAYPANLLDPSLPISCGDFDGDARVDLCFTNGASSALVAYGNGQGAFGAPVEVIAGLSGPNSSGMPHARADLDLDGRDELCAAVAATDALEIRVWRGASAPSAEHESYATIGTSSLAAFDLDADGRIELVGGSLASTAARLLVFRNPAGLPLGLAPFGGGTSGCQGTHALVGNAMPRLGASTFRLVCRGAPAQSVGIGAIGVAPDAGSDPLGLGLVLHVGLGAPIVPFQLTSSASGSASRAVPIPSHPTLAGAVLHAQVAWAWSASASCDPSPYLLSSSRGLTVTIQP
ncbi:MAG: VCBS repeat-containing protein [Planctomycetota bacterium]|nr:MAG: VCBS repeat-containing protein [Planctomycetota bacterium]